MQDEGPDLATVAELFAGHCTIEERLPWNGLSLVFRGHRGGSPLAVAVLPVECDSEDRVHRFESLIRPVEALSHPRIVRVTAHGVRHAVPFVEMAPDEGRTLAEELAEGAMPAERAFAIAKQILDALGHAHALGILHCDLTPANVLIHREPDGRDRVAVIGFGLAQVVRRARDTNVTGPTGKGSGPHAQRYLAPELLAGDPPTARSDLYSVGALLHHMLVGQPPSSKSPPAPDHARAVLAFAMAHAPSDRFEDAAAMSNALSEWLSRLADVATEPGVPLASLDDETPATIDIASVPGAAPVEALPAHRAAPTPAHRARGGTIAILGVVGLLVGAGGSALWVLSQRETERVTTPPTRTAPPVVPEVPEEPEPETSGGPLDGELPPPLAALLSRIEAGDRLTRDDLAPAYQYSRQHRDDPRPFLVLGRAFASMGWNSDAVERYERAYEADASAKNDPRMLSDLVVIATRPESGERAAAAIRRIWGAEAIPIVDEAIERTQRREERDRLTRLRNRLD